MERHLLEIYERELNHLYEVAAEFAAGFRKVGERLDLTADPLKRSRDPSVKLLLEGTAFLAARVHHTLEGDFPRFAQSLLETVYPGFLTPTPSMAVVEFCPAHGSSTLLPGRRIPRNTQLQHRGRKGDRTLCEFRTAHAVDLWPIRLTEASYVGSRDLEGLGVKPGLVSGAALRFRLEVDKGTTFAQLAAPKDAEPGAFNRLVLHIRDKDGQGYLRGPGRLASLVCEQLFARATSVILKWSAGKEMVTRILPASIIQPVGFSREESMLPADDRLFQGFRLLREYFAFPDRFLFAAVEGLSEPLLNCTARDLELLVFLRDEEPRLGSEKAKSEFDKTLFSLYATPCINLFPRAFDPITLSDDRSEYPVQVEEAVPLDYEVFSVERVVGLGMDDERREFRPFYAVRDGDNTIPGFFMAHREHRVPSPKELTFGQDLTYPGTNTYLSLVDAAAAPLPTGLRRLLVSGWATNRHLAGALGRDVDAGELEPVELEAPLDSAGPIRLLSGPTPPTAPALGGAAVWRLVSHLSLNFRSLMDDGSGDPTAALREMLRLYLDGARSSTQREVDGLSRVSAIPVARRVPGPGPVSFARGVELTLTFNEDAFRTTGLFVLGAVLAEYFRRFVSLNSFVEVVLASEQRGEIKRWLPRFGTRPLL